MRVCVCWDPERFHDLDKFIEAEAGYSEIGQLAEKIVHLEDGEALRADADLLQQLTPHLSADLQNRIEQYGAEDESLPQEVLAHLLDQHGTGRVLFRNQRAQISGFPGRQLHSYPLPLPNQYQGVVHDDLLMSLTPEQVSNDDWLSFDPRVSWMVEFLAAHHGEKNPIDYCQPRHG